MMDYNVEYFIIQMKKVQYLYKKQSQKNNRSLLYYKFKMHILFNILFMILIKMLSPVNSQIQIRDTLLAGQVSANHTIALNGYGPTDYIQAQLTVTNGVKLSSISMILNFQRTIQPSQVPIEFFQHKNPRDYISFDLDAMWNARQQYVNMRMYANSHVYITILNFDPVYRQSDISYMITIGPPGSNYPNCQDCNNRERTDSDCFCRNCKFGTFGKICSRTAQTLPSNIQVALSPYSFLYFTVLSSEKSIIEISASVGQVQVYLQYQQFPEEVASYYNAMKDSRYLIQDTLKITIESSNLNLLITLASFSRNGQNVSIKYYKDNSLSIAAIALISAFGGILLIFLIIILIFVIRRKCFKSTRVAEQNSLPHLAQNRLSTQEIQLYFPSCQYSKLVHEIPDKADSSLVSLNSKQNEKNELECVICLQKIREQDLIKIGYCKHIVHSQCLQTWFKKQRNCPYCRTEYSRSHTISQYQNLVAQNNNVELKDIDLMKNIYNLQYNSIFFSLQRKKLEECEQLEDNQDGPSRNDQIQQDN